MDALHEPNEAGCDAARSRSAPAFCRPIPVSPRPYQALESHQAAAPQPETAAPAPAAAPDTPSRPIRWRDALARVRLPSSDTALPPVAANEHGIPPVPASAEPLMNARSVSPYEARPYEAPPCENRPAAAFPTLQSSPAVSPTSQGSSPHAGEVRPLWTDADAGDEADETAASPAWAALARGVALLLGTLLVVDLFAAGGLPAGGPWWLDMRPLPEAISAALLGLSAVALIAFAVRPNLPVPIRTVAMLCICLLILIALKNATIYYGLLKRGDLHAGPPVAFGLHIAGCLGVVLLALRSTAGPTGVRGSLLVLTGFNLALVTLPIAHVACCGPIDARRPASAAIVWGPRSFEPHPDQRLEERVEAAVALHQSGLAGQVLLAGGPSGELLERLRTIARDGGVPEASIDVLPADAAATFAELRSRFPTEEGVTPTLLAVSDADHLPRVILAARHAGVKLSPVPATAIEHPDRTVVLREIIELWRCYFRQ